MREIVETWYEARRQTGTGGLLKKWGSLEEARTGIDDLNKRRERPAIFRITQIREATVLTDSNKFRTRSLTEVFVEEYPKKETA